MTFRNTHLLGQDFRHVSIVKAKPLFRRPVQSVTLVMSILEGIVFAFPTDIGGNFVSNVRDQIVLVSPTSVHAGLDNGEELVLF